MQYFSGEIEGKRLLGRSRHKWEDNMDGFKYMDSLAQGRIQ
jgi:hypothetical protein